MKNNILQFLLCILTLVVGAAAEDLFPKIGGIGFPVLLAAVQFSAVRRTTFAMVVFAIAAGAVEDALSSLPVMTSVSYFLAVATLTRWLAFPRAVIILTYPFYQLWLWLWVPWFDCNVFHRILIALPVGLLAVFAVGIVLAWAERSAAIDEAG